MFQAILKQKEVIITELIEVFKEYRNGNKDIFDSLYSDKVKYTYSDGMKEYDECHFIIVDASAAKVTNNVYRLFTQYGTFIEQGKYFKQVYKGSKDDFQKDAIMILLEIFKDKSFDAETTKDICGKLKHRLKKYMSDTIKTSVYSISDIYSDENDDECSYFETVSEMPDFDSNEIGEGYIGEIKELMDILKHYNVTDLCSPNATAQREIIDLIKTKYKYRYYSEDDCCDLPKDIEMISFYQLKYRKDISQQQYSSVLDELFKVMCDCTSDLKGLNITRKQYNDAKQRGDIYSNTQSNNISVK